ncbi:MAG: hypothetical protein JNM84_14775 [Planctomycetes bacterium]|nr:hypothetical protein [Planctomycetota bacterium]
MSARRKRPAARAASTECAHCGALVPPRARACRECGSDAETGWRDEEELFLESIELPEFDEADYRAAMGEITGRGENSSRRPRWVIWVAWILLAALVLLFTLAG